MDIIGNIDSKYRYVILVSKRAKQLLQGAKPKIELKTKNLIRIAQAEVRKGLIDYELLPTQGDDIEEPDETTFVGDRVAGEGQDAEDDGLAEEEAVELDEEEEEETD